MGKRTIIPFGPQHPVLPEPIHLDLVLEDEKVIEAIPSIGYIHRGLEKLVEKREVNDMVYIAARASSSAAPAGRAARWPCRARRPPAAARRR